MLIRTGFSDSRQKLLKCLPGEEVKDFWTYYPTTLLLTIALEEKFFAFRGGFN
jgi:hypothetical protein